MKAERQVFLSYARKDGEGIANGIRERLEREHSGLTVWQDLVKLLGGQGWLGQILEAIEKSQYLVMVMTPEAQRSATVQKEWRHARQNGVQVIPVMDEQRPRPDFATMPGVRSAAVSADGKWAVSASDDLALKAWDLESGKPIAVFIGDVAFPACAVTPDGRTIVAGDAGGAAHVLRLEENSTWATHAT